MIFLCALKRYVFNQYFCNFSTVAKMLLFPSLCLSLHLSISTITDCHHLQLRRKQVNKVPSLEEGRMRSKKLWIDVITLYSPHP